MSHVQSCLQRMGQLSMEMEAITIWLVIGYWLRPGLVFVRLHRNETSAKGGGYTVGGGGGASMSVVVDHKYKAPLGMAGKNANSNTFCDLTFIIIYIF